MALSVVEYVEISWTFGELQEFVDSAEVAHTPLEAALTHSSSQIDHWQRTMQRESSLSMGIHMTNGDATVTPYIIKQ